MKDVELHRQSNDWTAPDAVEAAIVLDRSHAAIARQDAGATDPLLQFLSDMGFPVPIASPEQLRAAFEYQTRMFAAVLGETDYLYIVTYKDSGKQRNDVTTSLTEANSLVERFKVLGASMSAKPKKSGIVKLARALGITGRVVRRSGLPDDSLATFAFVEYEARHEATGRSELGVGWCDLSERNGRISKHDAIATADTRAYNRAVLRLAGFGDVSAEEIIPVGTEESVVSVPEQPRFKKAVPLPPASSDIVVASGAAWAGAAASRDPDSRFLPPAAQETREARELRAKARRGDQEAAIRMGAQGIDWKGTAIDGSGYEPFAVSDPPVEIADVIASRQELSAAVRPAATGWDLSSNGARQDDAGLITEAAPQPLRQAGPPQDAGSGGDSCGIPAPDPRCDNITSAQAKKVSAALKKFCSDDVVKVREWLRQQCKVASTMDLRSNQYDTLIRFLEKSNKSEN
jgi:hypothetical protein